MLYSERRSTGHIEITILKSKFLEVDSDNESTPAESKKGESTPSL